MEGKHTPGPWNARIVGGADVVTADFRSFGICHIISDWAECEYIDYPKDEAIANAKLIAAAPDLLSACIEILACLQNAPERAYEQNLLQTAIDKATK